MSFLLNSSSFLCFSSPYLFCMSPPLSSSSQSESTGPGCGADCAQTGFCVPHLHNSAGGTFGKVVLLLFGAGLPRTSRWGIIACFNGASSASDLFIFWMAGVGLSFLLGRSAMTLLQISLLRPEQCWANE